MAAPRHERIVRNQNSNESEQRPLSAAWTMMLIGLAGLSFVARPGV